MFCSFKHSISTQEALSTVGHVKVIMASVSQNVPLVLRHLMNQLCCHSDSIYWQVKLARSCMSPKYICSGPLARELIIILSGVDMELASEDC